MSMYISRCTIYKCSASESLSFTMELVDLDYSAPWWWDATWRWIFVRKSLNIGKLQNTTSSCQPTSSLGRWFQEYLGCSTCSEQPSKASTNVQCQLASDTISSSARECDARFTKSPIPNWAPKCKRKQKIRKGLTIFFVCVCYVGIFGAQPAVWDFVIFLCFSTCFPVKEAKTTQREIRRVTLTLTAATLKT